MSLVVTPGYTWVNGEVETATKLNLAATPTIADGQAAVFSTLSTTGTASLANIGGAYVSIQTGGFIAAGSNLANDNLVLQGKGTGSVLIGYNGGSGGAQFFAGDTTQRAAITATGLAVTGALSATGFLSSGGYKYQTADLVTASGTPADLTGLSLSLVSGNTYSIRGVVYANGGGGSLSPTLLVHGSGGLVASYVVVSITALTSNGTTTTPDMSISFAMEASKGTNPTAGSTSIFMVEVTITVGTSGTFSLQGSRSGSGTATFYKGSFLRATLY